MGRDSFGLGNRQIRVLVLAAAGLEGYLGVAEILEGRMDWVVVVVCKASCSSSFHHRHYHPHRHHPLQNRRLLDHCLDVDEVE